MDHLDRLAAYFNEKEKKRLGNLSRSTQSGLPEMTEDEIKLSCLENNGTLFNLSLSSFSYLRLLTCLPHYSTHLSSFVYTLYIDYFFPQVTNHQSSTINCIYILEDLKR